MKIPAELETLAQLAVDAKASAGGASALADVSEENRGRLIRTAVGRAQRIAHRLERIERPDEDNVATMLFGPGLLLWGWIWANRSAIWFVLRIVARIILETNRDKAKR